MTKAIERWPASAPGRSRAVAHDGLIWIVANSANPAENIRQQIDSTLWRLGDALQLTGSARNRLLSVQIFLTDIADKPLFDAAWTSWIGDDPAGWPQRTCIQVGLTPGLLVEIQAVAAAN